MGGDGNVDTLLGKKSLNSHVAKDVFGYSLSYHSNDYLSSNISMLNYSNQDKTTSLGGLDLYNGNIKSMYTALSNTYESAFKPQTEVMNQAFKTHNTIYRYDQLNRLVAWRGYNRELSNTTPTLSGYSGTFNYDADGNILNLVQRSLAVSSDKTTFEEKEKDDFSYNYISGTNQLDYVDDYTPTDNFTNDIDPGQHAGNYQYDQIGQLIKDSSEEIERIHWNLKNKVTRIDYTGTKQGKSITFDYDAMGRRIAKHSKTPNGEITSTYYMLDAQGNTMSMFSKSSTSTKMYCDEFSIFGSKRIGTLYTALELIPNATNSTIYNMFDEPIGFYSISVNPDGSFGEAEILRSASRYSSIYSRTYGDKTYELQNHLSSVLQVITDRKIPEGLRGGLITSFKAEVRTVTDYAPFGSMLEGRSNSTLTALPPHNLHTTKRGYQGQLADDDIKGEGNSYNFEYRMHDPRLGRFFAVDPMAHKREWLSPYNFVQNNPISRVDPNGALDDEFDKNGKKISDLGGDKVNFYHQENGDTKIEDQKTCETNTIKNGEKLIKGFTQRNKSTDWSTLTSEFSSGKGPVKSLISDFDNSAKGIFGSLNKFDNTFSGKAREAVVEDGKSKGKVSFDYTEANPLTAGSDGWEQFLGRTNVSYYKLGNDKVLFMINDSKSFQSLALRIPLSWDRENGLDNFSNTYQTYIWTETMNEVKTKNTRNNYEIHTDWKSFVPTVPYTFKF
jgi:RHS repeat-associated protein